MLEGLSDNVKKFEEQKAKALKTQIDDRYDTKMAKSKVKIALNKFDAAGLIATVKASLFSK